MPSETLRSSVAIALVAAAISTAAFGQQLSFTGTPAIGQNLRFFVTGTPNAVYVLVASTVAGPSTLPPIGTLAIGQPFFFIVGPSASSPFQAALDPNGVAEVVLQIPLNFGLFGQSFHLQAAYVDPVNPPLYLTLTNGVSFTIASPILAPTLLGINPSTGGASGGTGVTITGDHFLPGPTTVTLGGQALQNLQVLDAQTIIGTTPLSTPGAIATLQVSTPGGTATLASAFTYVAESSTITSIVPDHTPIGGGTVITINGTGLGAGTTVFIGSTPLFPLVQNAGQIVALAPNLGQLGLVDAVVLSPTSLQVYSNAFRYTIPLDTGTGADGPFTPITNVTLDTNPTLGVFNFTHVNVPAGVTVTVVGQYALQLRCRGTVTIAGTFNLRGGNGTQGAAGIGGPGGYAGGFGFNGSGFGPGGGSSGVHADPCYSAPCGSYGTTTYGTGCSFLTYGNNEIVPLIGGSGSFGGSGGGGGGGGAVAIVATESVAVSGSIDVRGGGGGSYTASGGAIRIQSQNHVTITGLLTVAGGSPCAGNGRWYVQNWFGQAGYGTSALVPLGLY